MKPLYKTKYFLNMKNKTIVKFLSEHWRDCGVVEGDVLLVHSSLKRIFSEIYKKHNFAATPQTIYDSLLLALGSGGTLVLPLFNFDFPNTKFFDIRNTPSQMGALTEIGRKNPKSVRTGHPIYSFSVFGKHAREFDNIDNYSGYGEDSPFAKIKKLDGKIAIIGLTDQNSMTSYHFVEEQNRVDYRYFKEFTGTYIDTEGRSTEKRYALYVRDIEKGVKTDVNRMMEYLWQKGFYKGERYDEGYGMRTIKMEDLYNQTEKIIRNGKAIEYLYSIQKN